MACAEVVPDPLLVAAIDFGTTFSGYAFQTRSDFKKDPIKIQGFHWTTGSNTGLSMKTPTCILFNPSKMFHSFGIEAEDKYIELAEEEDHRNWYYFRRFKMQLYRCQEIPRDLTLEDDQGKHLPAMLVISECIKFLREHLMKQVRKRTDAIKPSEINWVLTVPAIWSDAAKQFMREAAVEAGIPGRQLMLALEPEAASIFCKHIPSERMVTGGKSCLNAFSPKTKYLILDAGGGTVDITVQEVQYDGYIKQLYMANGGDWGGTKVDEAFDEFLQELVGSPALYRFRDDDKAGHLDLLREFEIKKRSIKQDQTSKVTFKVPVSLKDAYEHVNEGRDLSESLSRSSKRVEWTRDKLRMEPDSARDLFSSPCQHITDHLQTIFDDEKVEGTNIILMVGGFSESPMLRKAVERAFPNQTIIIPQEAGLAVLKGAVLFGFEPRIISTRICKATYGVKTNSPFKEGTDPEDKKTIIEGDVLCKDRFDKHVEIHQAVGIDEEFGEQIYVPVRSDQTAMKIEIWTSLYANPRYTYDPGCSYHGELHVQMPDTTGGKKRQIGVKMIFGKTELEVHALNKRTGEQTNAKFDFLR